MGENSDSQKTHWLENLKRNWYFPISAMGYFCLFANFGWPRFFVGMPITFVVILYITSNIRSIREFATEGPRSLQIVSALTALGVCLAGPPAFLLSAQRSGLMSRLNAWLTSIADIPWFSLLAAIGALSAFIFVYICTQVFWRQMRRIVSSTDLFCGFSVRELTVYGVLLLISIVIITVAFMQTQAFYGTPHKYSLMYTADSPILVKENAYLVLTHRENDIRQPLFALFAAPFIGIPYLIGRLFPSAAVRAMLLAYPQAALLLAANLILTKMLELSPGKRICFMLLAFCSYAQLLFTLVMEQYIVAYFWLVFCCYMIFRKGNPGYMPFFAAGSTLSTSLVLALAMSDQTPYRHPFLWLRDIIKAGLAFVLLLAAFCRLDVVFNFLHARWLFTSFSGESIPMLDRVYQYMEFVHDYFLTPNAGPIFTQAYPSWKLAPITELNLVGVVILLAAIAGAILTRRQKGTQITVFWLGFSLVILVILGWGTAENSLILYALYFGWPLMALVFRLFEYLGEKLRLSFFLPAVSTAGAAVMLAVNIPGLLDMFRFAVEYYPA